MIIDEKLLMGTDQEITENAESTHVLDMLNMTKIGPGKRIKAAFTVTETFVGEVGDSGDITGITQAEPAVVTSAAHGLSNGDLVLIEGVEGMTELNGNVYKVANVATNTFELTDEDDNDIDSTGFDEYTEGGTWTEHDDGLVSVKMALQQSSDNVNFVELVAITVPLALLKAGIRTDMDVPAETGRYVRGYYTTAGDREPVEGKISLNLAQA